MGGGGTGGRWKRGSGLGLSGDGGSTVTTRMSWSDCSLNLTVWRTAAAGPPRFFREVADASEDCSGGAFNGTTWSWDVEGGGWPRNLLLFASIYSTGSNFSSSRCVGLGGGGFKAHAHTQRGGNLHTNTLAVNCTAKFVALCQWWPVVDSILNALTTLQTLPGQCNTAAATGLYGYGSCFSLLLPLNDAVFFLINITTFMNTIFA